MSESLSEIADCTHGVHSLEYAESFDSLWDSALKCRCNVGWKPSVKQYMNNIAVMTYRNALKLQTGKWEDGETKPITITYPKKREGLAVRFPDRVVQRSLNDNILYPEMARHFVNANCACQKGKGTDYARMLAKKSLHRNYLKYGTDFYVLLIDISGYYPNMRHDIVHAMFARYLQPSVVERIDRILDKQCNGDIGYYPGSQLVQIAGISLLNGIDHIIKEKLGCRDYVRVMDDFLLMHPCKEYLEICLEEICALLSELGFKTNPKKTKIVSIKEGFTWLGFRYSLGTRHEFVMTPKSESIRHERKKLARLRKVCTREKADECLTSYLAYIERGNTYRLQQRLIAYQNELWRKI